MTCTTSWASGFLESVYGEATTMVLRAQGHHVDQERSVEVKSRAATIGVHRTDLVVTDRVIAGLKSARTIESAHEVQLLYYLKATRFEVGRSLTSVTNRSSSDAAELRF
jgi:GxxExxY protein